MESQPIGWRKYLQIMYLIRATYRKEQHLGSSFGELEAEAPRLQNCDQPGLYTQTLSQKNTNHKIQRTKQQQKTKNTQSSKQGSQWDVVSSQ